jgi:hypothetical protein
MFLTSDAGRKAKIDRKSIIPGSMNIDAGIREAITEAFKKTSLSRYEVSAHISSAIGRDVSKTSLDAFSAESKENHKLPASYVPALAVVTGDYGILKLLCSQAGGAFIPDSETLRLALRNIQAEKRELREREDTIKKLLEALAEAEK